MLSPCLKVPILWSMASMKMRMLVRVSISMKCWCQCPWCCWRNWLRCMSPPEISLFLPIPPSLSTRALYFLEIRPLLCFFCCSTQTRREQMPTYFSWKISRTPTFSGAQQACQKYKYFCIRIWHSLLLSALIRLDLHAWIGNGHHFLRLLRISEIFTIWLHRSLYRWIHRSINLLFQRSLDLLIL